MGYVCLVEMCQPLWLVLLTCGRGSTSRDDDIVLMEHPKKWHHQFISEGRYSWSLMPCAPTLCIPLVWQKLISEKISNPRGFHLLLFLGIWNNTQATTQMEGLDVSDKLWLQSDRITLSKRVGSGSARVLWEGTCSHTPVVIKLCNLKLDKISGTLLLLLLCVVVVVVVCVVVVVVLLLCVVVVVVVLYCFVCFDFWWILTFCYFIHYCFFLFWILCY